MLTPPRSPLLPAPRRRRLSTRGPARWRWAHGGWGGHVWMIQTLHTGCGGGHERARWRWAYGGWGGHGERGVLRVECKLAVTANQYLDDYAGGVGGARWMHGGSGVTVGEGRQVLDCR